MELMVLGADGMYASPGGATSGYLLREDGFSLWIELGSGKVLAGLSKRIAPDAEAASAGTPEEIAAIAARVA